jgi:hypothetical protein
VYGDKTINYSVGLCLVLLFIGAVLMLVGQWMAVAQ